MICGTRSLRKKNAAKFVDEFQELMKTFHISLAGVTKDRAGPLPPVIE